MSSPQHYLTLTNIQGRSANFECSVAPDQKVTLRTVRQDPDFPASHTAHAVLTTPECTLHLSGDAWRFVEGTLGLHNLLTALAMDDGYSFVTEFLELFENTRNDDEALSLWEALMAQATL